jgi:hypothetical protein
MAAKKGTRANKGKKQGASGARSRTTAEDKRPAEKALPKPTGQPGEGQGRVDVTGIVPEGIRVDPDVTEGHPGYEESGDSEIIPTERLIKGGASEGKGAG